MCSGLDSVEGSSRVKGSNFLETTGVIMNQRIKHWHRNDNHFVVSDLSFKTKERKE